MMMQPPPATLLGQMRMGGMSREQVVQRRGGRVDIAMLQIDEYAAQPLRQRNERRNMGRGQLRDGRRVDGEDARERSHCLTRGKRDLPLLTRGELVDERFRHQQAGVFVTI